MNLLAQFQAARRAGAPLVAIRTSDPAATAGRIQGSYNSHPPPLIDWDTIRGMVPRNDQGFSAIAAAGGGETGGTLTDPVMALTVAARLPERSILFFHQAQMFLGDPAQRQAVWNLRDQFKSNTRTLVLLGSQFRIPAELSNDVLVLDEPLPTREDLAETVKDAHVAANIQVPDQEVLAKAVDALAGLAAFPAEQATAMSFRDGRLDLGDLWERKRQMIMATPGLSVWRGFENFASLGGLANLKGFLGRIVHGNDAPHALVFLDEIEKATAGATEGAADSGVSKDMLKVFLTEMQDRDYAGMTLAGIAGTGKSEIVKGAGNEARIPTIILDLGAARGNGLVGDAEATIREAFKVIHAVSQGRALFIATSNDLSKLPPELRRRFNLGTFFFDLPTAEERAAIWPIHLRRYFGDAAETQAGPRPADDAWTGAEIRSCCQIAFRLSCSLQEAAGYVVPIAVARAAQIEQQRRDASGRLLSASYPGVYVYSTLPPAAAPTRRTIHGGDSI